MYGIKTGIKSLIVGYNLQMGLIRIIYNMLNRGTGGRALTQSETLRRVVIIMSTYEELSLIVSVALLIVAILTYTHKKYPSCS